jgi:hypothetical protein
MQEERVSRGGERGEERWKGRKTRLTSTALI